MSHVWLARRPAPLRGSVWLPGDKSISHRALLLHVLAEGEGLLVGLNSGADVQASRRAVAALGCAVRTTSEGVRVIGRAGRPRPATSAIDCANSGTTLRLLAGIVAAQPFTTTLDGDLSLRRRPMERISAPLRALGARVDGPNGGRTPPLIVTGGALRDGVRVSSPVASAQVKSCLLLAAAAARVGIEVVEPLATRDHTERLLRAMGATIESTGTSVRLAAGPPLRAIDVQVPGDPSAAALLIAAALAVPGSRLLLPAVGVNPGRIGFLDVLGRMGLKVELLAHRTSGGEPIADLRVESEAQLQAVEVESQQIPSLVDEIPALAVACALAHGTSRLRGLGELRVKESDRVAGLRQLLQHFQVTAREEGDDLVIEGGTPVAHEHVDAGDDHRMVMAAAALALAALARCSDPNATCAIVGMDAAAVSFPGFTGTLERLQAPDARESTQEPA